LKNRTQKPLTRRAGHPRPHRRQNDQTSKGRKACFFEKKQQKTLDHFGFGLSGWARPSFAKVFWFFFSNKKALPPLAFAAHHRRAAT
jgi:hypothetical protein